MEIDKENNDLYCAGVVFTSDVMNAGMDCTQLQYILRVGYSPSTVTFFQEIGLVGQRQNTTPQTDIVDVVINSAGYRFLLRRD